MRTFNQIVEQHHKVDETIKVGDYVFATKYLDCDPNDRWRVDIVEGKSFNESWFAVHFNETGVIPFRFAQRITAEEGEYLIMYMKMCETTPRSHKPAP